MAKRIIDLVQEKKARMLQNPAEANDNAVLAIAAVMGGVESDAWTQYMSQFVEKDREGKEVDPRQLRRLRATDETAGDFQFDLHRAYMVANGTCGANSPDGLGFDFAVASIDEGLDGLCETAVKRENLPPANIE